ncbi:hypothetical protein QQ008_24010 [Fulvivirgaceae bacterium BMA10]|uniref:Cell envelope biogenesis protein OmpA n=1 Tax=Splendidivirga corallicola TaxID=3051826 RepID=A0ABT8KYJ6_9BACT|nr:hypothetical protein [Fulvivirgaceae bacterium BMA10]
MVEGYRFKKLKEILFEQDRRAREELQSKLIEIEKGVNTREGMEARVNPILEDKVTFLQQNFPTLFGPAVTQAIKREIKESQDEVVEALYPIIGKMVKKYIVKEMELLSERIDRQLDLAFSWEGWLRRIKGWFGGVSEKDIITQQLMEPTLEEIFVIQQNSGLLIGSYSKNNTIDQDMIAGMLTAIKAFVQDAFSRGGEDLEMIEYETYKLIIRNFKSFYITAVISGPVNMEFKNELDQQILNFAEQVLKQEGQIREDKMKGHLEHWFS